jgi:hypothetical protein
MYSCVETANTQPIPEKVIAHQPFLSSSSLKICTEEWTDGNVLYVHWEEIIHLMSIIDDQKFVAQ